MKKWALFLIGIIGLGASTAAAAPTRSLMENLAASNTSFVLNTAGRYGVVGSTQRVGGSTATWTVGGNVKTECVEFASGTFQCGPAASGADITGVTAGYGLTGGGTSGTVILNLDGATTSYVQNRDTLQANTTAFPEILKTSSATITDATITRSTFGAVNVTGLTVGTTIQAYNIIVSTINGVKVGVVKQAVMATYTGTFATTSTSFVRSHVVSTITVTSPSCTIRTTACGILQNSAGTNNTYATISRGNTNLMGTDGGQIATTNQAAGFRAPACIRMYDSSHGLTNATTTYGVMIRVTGGSGEFGNGAANMITIDSEEICPN